MGHFGSVMTDLPWWREMGATLVQDGRFGPSSMNKDGTLGEGARVLLADLDKADMYGVKTDVLLSPHYFPAWAYTASNTAGLREGADWGSLNFNIDHPAAKDAIGRWCEVVSAAMKDKPALLSICLSNEPVYDKSGKTARDRCRFTGDISARLRRQTSPGSTRSTARITRVSTKWSRPLTA